MRRILEMPWLPESSRDASAVKGELLGGRCEIEIMCSCVQTTPYICKCMDFLMWTGVLVVLSELTLIRAASEKVYMPLFVFLLLTRTSLSNMVLLLP